MEDIERYGDYDEIDEEPSGDKSNLGLIIKIVIISLCLLVVGVILFRVILFNHYPKAMKNIYFNDELASYYNANDGKIGAQTQKMSAPYDNRDYANFMADNLIVIREVEQLQFSLRYNSSIFDTIEEKYGVRLDEKSEDLFTFELERGPLDREEWTKIGELDYSAVDTKLMYTYFKLVFDDVEFSNGAEQEWIRVKITIKDIPDADPFYILIYEDTENSHFSEYKLSRKEHP